MRCIVVFILRCFKEAEGEGMAAENVFTAEVHFSDIKDADLAQVWPWEAITGAQLTMLVVAPAIEVAMLVDDV